MDKIIAATFDIADQKCVTYNALEWHNFIADTRERCDDPSVSLEDMFDEIYGDEFWFCEVPNPFAAYSVAFDMRSEEFIVCNSDNQCEMVMEMAWASGDQEEIFWADE